MSDEQKNASQELTAFVGKILAEYIAYINATPGLLSLLHDIDLLPEQVAHVLSVNPRAAGPNACRMAAVCDLYRKAYSSDPAKEVAP